jgi:hypothetical protein
LDDAEKGRENDYQGASQAEDSKKGRGLWRSRLPARGPAELLAVLAHNGGCRFEPDADLAIGANKSAFGGNPPDNVFGRHWPPGWRVLRHDCQLMPVNGAAVKNGREEYKIGL